MRTSIRDHWDAPSSPLRKAKNALSTTLGLPVKLYANFTELRSKLGPSSFDAEAIVPNLASALTSCLHALDARLNREEDDDGYADRFLERCNSVPGRAAQGLDVYVEAVQRAGIFGIFPPTFHWHPYHRGALRLGVVETRTLTVEPHALATMINELGADDATPQTTVASSSAEISPGEDDASEWAGIVTPSQSAASVVDVRAAGSGAVPSAQAEAALPPERMPRDLPEPHALFARTAPYLLQVSTERGFGGAQRVVLRVACSHQRTLEVLMEYLRRYLRMDETTSRRVRTVLHAISRAPFFIVQHMQGRILTNLGSQAPVVKLRLRESILAGPLYDSLEIEGSDERSLLRNDMPAINQVLVLSFVEGVLGYRFMTETNGVLIYRRDRPFE